MIIQAYKCPDTGKLFEHEEQFEKHLKSLLHTQNRREREKKVEQDWRAMLAELRSLPSAEDVANFVRFRKSRGVVLPRVRCRPSTFAGTCRGANPRIRTRVGHPDHLTPALDGTVCGSSTIAQPIREPSIVFSRCYRAFKEH
jgi:uncharacterized C2H2 Zn-finger protein